MKHNFSGQKPSLSSVFDKNQIISPNGNLSSGSGPLPEQPARILFLGENLLKNNPQSYLTFWYVSSKRRFQLIGLAFFVIYNLWIWTRINLLNRKSEYELIRSNLLLFSIIYTVSALLFASIQTIIKIRVVRSQNSAQIPVLKLFSALLIANFAMCYSVGIFMVVVYFITTKVLQFFSFMNEYLLMADVLGGVCMLGFNIFRVWDVAFWVTSKSSDMLDFSKPVVETFKRIYFHVCNSGLIFALVNYVGALVLLLMDSVFKQEPIATGIFCGMFLISGYAIHETYKRSGIYFDKEQ